MKVAVLNFSGNVGKSTVAKYLLQPRIPGARLVAVETINADEGGADAMRGREFGQLQRDLMKLEAAVVDIGASHVEEVMRLMTQYEGSHEEFDMFVVPVTKEAKQVRDTIGTLDALGAMGVGRDRIRLVFNRVEPGTPVQQEFAGLLDYVEDAQAAYAAPKATIYDSELYQHLRSLGHTVETLLADPTDWRARLRNASDAEEKDRCAEMIAMRRLALSAKRNLDEVYAAVMG
jgi:hypothetical protein